jgi:hypothetical protein
MHDSMVSDITLTQKRRPHATVGRTQIESWNDVLRSLSKAFDTVNIEILLKKLAAIRILGDDLHLFKSYNTLM